MTQPRRRRSRSTSASSTIAQSCKKQKQSPIDEGTTDNSQNTSTETAETETASSTMSSPYSFSDLPHDSICHILTYLEPVVIRVVENRLHRKTNRRQNPASTQYMATFPNQTKTFVGSCWQLKHWFGKFRSTSSIEFLYRNIELDSDMGLYFSCDEKSQIDRCKNLGSILKHVQFLHFRAEHLERLVHCLNAWYPQMPYIHHIYAHVKNEKFNWHYQLYFGKVSEWPGFQVWKALQADVLPKMKELRFSCKTKLGYIETILKTLPNLKRFHYAYCHKDCSTLFREFDFEYFRFLGGDELNMNNMKCCIQSRSLRTLCLDDIHLWPEYQSLRDTTSGQLLAPNSTLRRLELLPKYTADSMFAMEELLPWFPGLEVLSCYVQSNLNFFELLSRTNVSNLILSSCTNAVEDVQAKFQLLAKMPHLEYLELNLKNPLNLMEQLRTLLSSSSTLRSITVGTCKTYHKRATEAANDLMMRWRRDYPRATFHVVQTNIV